MRVAKGNVAGRDILPLQIGELDGHGGVGQARPADLFQVIQPADQAMLRLVEIRQGVEGAKLARFRPLAISDVQHGETIIKVRNRGGHATVHAATGEDDGERLVRAVRGSWSVVSYRVVSPSAFMRSAFSFCLRACLTLRACPGPK